MYLWINYLAFEGKFKYGGGERGLNKAILSFALYKTDYLFFLSWKTGTPLKSIFKSLSLQKKPNQPPPSIKSFK